MKKEAIGEILDQLLEDALLHDSKQRFYKLADDKMLTLISNLGEYFVHKINRSSAEEGSVDSQITVIYRDGRDTSNTPIQETEQEEAQED